MNNIGVYSLIFLGVLTSKHVNYAFYFIRFLVPGDLRIKFSNILHIGQICAMDKINCEIINVVYVGGYLCNSLPLNDKIPLNV